MTDRNSPPFNVQSVWRCKWCGTEYQHPITGAVAVGHWCGDVRRELRNLTRLSRSVYDEMAADQRNPHRQRLVFPESTPTQQASETPDRTNEGRFVSQRGQISGTGIAPLHDAPAKGGVA